MKKLKIVFVRLSSFSHCNLHPQDLVIPFGIAYSATLLSKKGYEVEVIDSRVENLSLGELSEAILKKRGDLIFIDCITPEVDFLKSLIHLIKNNPSGPKFTFAMGQHASVLPQTFLNYESKIKACIVGEPEYTILELVESIDRDTNNKNINSQKGIAYFDRRINQIRINPAREYIQNLDGLPFIDYTLFDIGKYKKFSAQLFSFKKAKWGFILSSRGCPYQCTFCSPVLRHSWGREFRFQSPDRVVDELQYLRKRFGFNVFSFEDDNFTFNRQRVIEICKQILERRLNIRWAAQAHLNHLDEELIYKMKEAGCNTLRMGVESGSQRILNELKKQLDIKEVRKKVVQIKKAKMGLTLFFMINNPTETDEEMHETLKFAQELNPTMLHVYFCTPYPGSLLYDSIGNGRDFASYCHYDKLCYNLSNADAKFVYEFQKKFYRQFFFTKRYLINYFKNRGRYNLFKKDEWHLILKAAKYLLNPDNIFTKDKGLQKLLSSQIKNGREIDVQGNSSTRY